MPTGSHTEQPLAREKTVCGQLMARFTGAGMRTDGQWVVIVSGELGLGSDGVLRRLGMVSGWVRGPGRMECAGSRLQGGPIGGYWGVALDSAWSHDQLKGLGLRGGVRGVAG